MLSPGPNGLQIYHRVGAGCALAPFKLGANLGVRGVMLKGNTGAMLLPELRPMLALMLAAGVLVLLRYRQTLD